MKRNTKHRRRSIRLKGYDYSHAGAYFITVCTRNGKCLFGDVINGKMRLNAHGNIVSECWNKIPTHFPNVETDAFVVMPNHIHGIIIINNVGAIHELPLRDNKITRRRMLIPKVVGFYKMNTAKLINQFLNTPGVHIWQRNYYEHIIRNKENLNEIREYIVNNPLKWNLDKENPKISRQMR